MEAKKVSNSKSDIQCYSRDGAIRQATYDFLLDFHSIVTMSLSCIVFFRYIETLVKNLQFERIPHLYLALRLE